MQILQALSRYDYIIIGAGLAGCVAARELTDKGAQCLVVDKRNHIGGNCYSYMVGEIEVHKYGPHIFHTNIKKIWDYINRFSKWKIYIHRVSSLSRGKLYDFPPNANVIKELGEKELYERFYEGYTKKAWFGESPPFDVKKRIPIKTTTDNNYWTDRYQGLPEGGYTAWFESILKGIDIGLGVTIPDIILRNLDVKIVYCGRIDRFYEYVYGTLQFRGVKFINYIYDMNSIQRKPVTNYADLQYKLLRQMEWKFFTNNIVKDCGYTIVTSEYADKNGEDYPYPDKENSELYKKYAARAKGEGIILIGRSGLYKYMNMDETIKSTLDIINGDKNERNK